MTTHHETLIAKDAEELDAFAAELFGRAVSEAVTLRGTARVALSGGSTPRGAYRLIAGFDLPWERVEWFWVDERAVPPTSDRSNYGAANADLGLEKGPVSKGKIHRMQGESPDLAAAAALYSNLLRERFGVAKAVAFDAMVAGIGDDGHTASLFPGMGTVATSDRLVIPVPAQPDKGLEARLSLTAQVICEARLLLVLASGAKKRPVIEKARSPGSEDEIPSRIFQRATGRVVWILDEPAAG